MQAQTLIQRIQTETGLSITPDGDPHRLAGMLNRYRPMGEGLERLLGNDAVEQAVHARLRRIYEATAPGCKSGDLYFVVRQPSPIDASQAMNLAREHVARMAQLAVHLKDSEVAEALAEVEVTSDPAGAAGQDDDLGILVYEFLTDFLAGLQPRQHEIFFLKEAFYSMANDYFLMAYVVWPAAGLPESLAAAMDPYFELWRHGVELKFRGKSVTVKLPAR
jgi:hypothetical protein